MQPHEEIVALKNLVKDLLVKLKKAEEEIYRLNTKITALEEKQKGM